MTDWLGWPMINLVWGPLLFVTLGVIMALTLPYELGFMAVSFTSIGLLIYYVDLIRVN